MSSRNSGGLVDGGETLTWRLNFTFNEASKNDVLLEMARFGAYLLFSL
jgi:hypothetical protein